MKRHFFANVKRNNAGTKIVDFGGATWGSMSKEDANARCRVTGNGLVVIDIDTKDLNQVDKKLMKLIGDPTVETAKGYHYYFTGGDDIGQTQGLFSKVDIRNRGGFVFDKYWGHDESIYYKKVGKTREMPKELHRYLTERRKERYTAPDGSSDLPYFGDQWSFIEEGERHAAALNFIIRDFRSGRTEKEVKRSYRKWIRSIGLRWNHHEKELFRKRVGDSGARRYSTPSGLEGKAIDADVLKETPSERQEDEDRGIDLYFDGHVVWDPDKTLFAEIRDDSVVFYKPNNFTQTIMSKSGISKMGQITELKAGIPARYVVYRPDQEGSTVNENGDPAVNTYRGVRFGENKGMPPTIDKVLDNLFQGQMDAKEDFINWMAFIVQRRRRSGVAWGFFGVQGSGKGLITEILGKIVGYRNAAMNISDSQLTSQYSDYGFQRLLVHINEPTSDYHGRHGVAGKIKILVTDEHIQINMKYVPAFQVENYSNVIMNSNAVKPIELDDDDRRWNMVTSQRALKDADWWNNGSAKQAKNEAMDFGAYLRDYPLDEIRATTPMRTSGAKANLIKLTTSAMQQLGKAIMTRDADEIKDLCELEPDDLLNKQIDWSIKHSRWSSDLLTKLCRHAAGNNDFTPKMMTNRLMLPYLKGDRGLHRKMNALGERKRGIIIWKP